MFKFTFYLNPLFHEFYFTSIFEIEPTKGSYRLPTHRRGAHRKCFTRSLLISELVKCPLYRWRCKAKGLTHYCLTGTLFSSRSANFDFNLRRDHQKTFLWASRLWVGRRKEPILGYVQKNYERNNSGSNGLSLYFTYKRKFVCEIQTKGKVMSCETFHCIW